MQRGRRWQEPVQGLPAVTVWHVVHLDVKHSLLLFSFIVIVVAEKPLTSYACS